MTNATLILILSDQLSPNLASLKAGDRRKDIVDMAERQDTATNVRRGKETPFLFSAMRHFYSRSTHPFRKQGRKRRKMTAANLCLGHERKKRSVKMIRIASIGLVGMISVGYVAAISSLV